VYDFTARSIFFPVDGNEPITAPDTPVGGPRGRRLFQFPNATYPVQTPRRHSQMGGARGLTRV